MKLLYFTFSNPQYSVNSVYISGLRENNVAVKEFFYRGKSLENYLRAIKDYWRNRKDANFIIVGYDSPQLATLIRLFSRKKIIYNALCSVRERYIISRALARRFSLKDIYYWLVDFLAVHSSSLVMLETESQIKYFHKIFGMPKNKGFRAWTGVDGNRFFYNPKLLKFDIFTVIFRGGLLPEAGAEYVVEAAKKLEGKNINIIMHASDQELPQIKKLIRNLKPKNLKLITKFLSDENLRTLMQKSHLSLGQFSNHERLKRTIPHKAYESLALRLPYLTAKNRGVMELLKPGETCLVCNSADAESLAQQINWAKKNPSDLDNIAEKGFGLYENKLKSKILAKKLLDYL